MEPCYPITGALHAVVGVWGKQDKDCHKAKKPGPQWFLSVAGAPTHARHFVNNDPSKNSLLFKNFSSLLILEVGKTSLYPVTRRVGPHCPPHTFGDQDHVFR